LRKLERYQHQLSTPPKSKCSTWNILVNSKTLDSEIQGEADAMEILFHVEHCKRTVCRSVALRGSGELGEYCFADEKPSTPGLWNW